MHNELTVSLSSLFGFLLVLARVGGAMVFVPFPGMKGGTETARLVLALGFTLALFPVWPVIDPATVTLGSMAMWLLMEAALGLAVGVAVAFLTESFVLAAQVIGLQAGYAYSSTIDPTTNADSGILLILAQLMAGMLFFAMGLDREVLRILAQSLEVYPAGTFLLTGPTAMAIAHLGVGMFATGLRMAMPTLALLVLVDISLALLGRLNAQLQLLTLSFPAKMLVTLGLLAVVSTVFPLVYGGYARTVLDTLRAALLRPLATGTL